MGSPRPGDARKPRIDARALLWPSLVAVAVAVVLGGTWPYFEGLLDANERPRLLAGIALVEAGSVHVDGPFTEGIPVGPDVAEAADGHLVPNKPPGATLVAALAWLLLKAAMAEPTLRAYTILARVLGGLAPTLVLAGLAWRHERAWAEHGGAGRARADFAVLAWLLATPAWANAKLVFGHSLAACLLGAGVLALVGRPGAKLDPARAALAGALAGSAVLVEYTAVFAGPAIAAWLVWRERGRWSVIAAALGGALVPIAALASYHARVFGSPWTTPYHRVVNDDFAAIHGRGLLGLQLPSATSLYEHLISPWGGLLVWAPLCLLGLIGGVHAARSRDLDADERARQLLFAGVAGSLLLVLIGLEQSGGWRVGPRYYVLAMPLAIPGLAHLLAVLTRQRQAIGWSLILGLGLAATVSNFLAANWFPHLIPHGNPLGDQLAPLVRAGHVAHGLSPWLVAIAALGLWAAALWQLRGDVPLAAWIGGAVLGALLLFAQFRVPESDPMAELESEVLERLWEPDEHGASPKSRRLVSE